MITSTMTEAEVFEEIKADLLNIVNVSDSKDAKARRVIQKSVLFPVRLHTFVTSSRKNKWMILWEAPNKKYIDSNSLLTFVCYYETDHGRYAFMPTWDTGGKFILIMYPPHFFSRFAKRMNLDITGIDLIKRYFEENNNYTYNTKNEILGDKVIRNIFGSSKEGVAMGVISENKDIFLFKTFITYEMTKGEQIEKFAESERMRKEIHEDEINFLNYKR